jgi:hypothetical protein
LRASPSRRLAVHVAVILVSEDLSLGVHSPAIPLCGLGQYLPMLRPKHIFITLNAPDERGSLGWDAFDGNTHASRICRKNRGPPVTSQSVPRLKSSPQSDFLVTSMWERNFARHQPFDMCWQREVLFQV